MKLIGLSVDPLGNHEKWAEDIAETQGAAPNYPLIGDSEFTVSKLYGMLPADVDARKIWPEGWQSPRPYIRIVPQPQNS